MEEPNKDLRMQRRKITKRGAKRRKEGDDVSLDREAGGVVITFGGAHAVLAEESAQGARNDGKREKERV